MTNEKSLTEAETKKSALCTVQRNCKSFAGEGKMALCNMKTAENAEMQNI